MKNLVSIFAGHDASVSFWNAETNKYYTIEIERLVRKRYFRLHEIILLNIKKIFWNSVGILLRNLGVLRMIMKQY